MAFYNGWGEPTPEASGGVSITEHNLFDSIGGVLVDGYTISSNKLAVSSEDRVVYAKLSAGNSYLFAFDIRPIIYIVTELPDVEMWKTKAISNWNYYGWVQNFWSEQNTNNGSYIYTPETDMYVMAAVAKTNNLYVWDAELTGNINPGSAIDTTSNFRNWGKEGYFPFSTTLDDMEDIEVDEELKKGVIKSTNINRIYSGNVPIIWIGDSIMFAGSNVGVEDSYRHNAALSLDLPWNYHAVSGTTITDGYGMEWATDKGTGYSGFISTEVGSSKAETPKELYKQAKMVVLAMGTNDFGNNAPLGTVDDTGTDTFYGAFRAWLKYFQTYKPDMPIIVITPFKRDTWATPNNQNLILPDYVRAMYVVAREFKHVYLLDVFSKWYGDTDNQVIRARNSIDGIHPSAWFHDCFTMDLVQKIKEVCALEGIIA